MNALAGLTGRVSALLERWAEWAESECHEIENHPAMQCYGPGYIHWGVQSNWNYVAAMATLADMPGVGQPDRWRQRALASLRFALDTHITGTRPGNDSKKWGSFWISMLGIERSMHGVGHLRPNMTQNEDAALRRVLVSEADWLLREPCRNGHYGVNASKWNASGRNVPESNIWSGALLWRAAQMYPEEPAAPEWMERAHEFFINGVSVETDATDHTMVAGKPVSEWYTGANFFPNYALDHHGYLNVGYMTICVSNAAILQFDMRQLGLPAPDSLHHHQRDLWNVLRRFVFADGRLARIGGDSRVRYSYCQEYLIPALMYAADRWKDAHALDVLCHQIEWIEREAVAGGDGSFYGARLERLARTNPHYYTRLESDRACALAMMLNYQSLVDAPPPPKGTFEDSVAGEWMEEEHGAVLSRSTTRLASVSWRSFGLGQGLCVPPTDSSMAEWSLNLSPVVRFLGDNGRQDGAHRRLLGHDVQTFPGGFVSCGSIMEGVDTRLEETGSCTDQAASYIAFAALPDGITCLGLQYVECAPDRRGVLTELKGLHLGIPNDVFNSGCRTIYTANGESLISAAPSREEAILLGSRWLSVDGKCGVVLLYGGDSLVLSRSAEKRGGPFKSLWVEEVCCALFSGLRYCRPDETLLDIGYAVLAGANPQATAAIEGGRLAIGEGKLRGIWVSGQDGKRYGLVANFGDEQAETILFGRRIALRGGQARVVAAD